MLVRTRLLGLVAVVLLLGAAPAHAQSDDEPESQLGGYIAGSAGWAVSMQPFIPALLPTGDAPFETTISLSTATVKSGGNALGRAAIFWPGSAAANLGPLLAVGASQPFVGSLIPPYPGFVEASAKDGAVERSAGPGISMKAFGSESRAEGDVRTPDIDLPGLLKVDSVSSQSFAEVTDVDVSTSSVVTLEGVSLINGAIKATSIYSKSLTRSTGDTSNADGVLHVVGLTVNGIAVEVTGAGIRAVGLPPEAAPAPGASAPFPGANPDDALNQALTALGASIRVTRLSQKSSGGAADRLANALVLTVNNPAVPGSRVEITLASTGSAALATLPVATDLGELETPDLDNAGSDVLGSSESASLGDFAASPEGNLALGPSPEADALSQAGSSSTGTNVEGSLAGYRFGGLPIGLVLLLIAASVVLGRWIRTFLVTKLIR